MVRRCNFQSWPEYPGETKVQIRLRATMIAALLTISTEAGCEETGIILLKRSDRQAKLEQRTVE